MIQSVLQTVIRERQNWYYKIKDYLYGTKEDTAKNKCCGHRMVIPDSWILIFFKSQMSDPGSQIQQEQKREGGKVFYSNFLCSYKSHEI